MERWEIRATPSPEDADRHLLLMKGGPADVAALLRKFGASLGRPSPSRVDGFNLSLVLHRFKPELREKVEAWLRKTSPAAAPAAPEPPPIPALKPVEAEKPSEKPKLVPLAPEASVPPPVPVPEIAPPPPAAKPAAPTPAPAAPAPAAAAKPADALPEPALTVELREDWTFETLLVGAYNRFAHAAAMSVVSSPGTMYNPLFLYGVPGTGKSHMIHAIGAALSKGLGGAVLLNTTGSRLSRAVDSALAGPGTAEIDAKVKGSKALLIDDIHLLAVSDQNKDALAKIFKSFFDRRQQVVITSLYPPRALGALEEALKFSFSKGWSVDLKIPSPAIQKDLIASAADRTAIGLASEEIALLHEKLAQWGYQDLSLWLKRVRVFKTVREAAGQPAALKDLLQLIYEPILASAGEAAKAPPAFSGAAAPSGGTEPMAVITPKGKDGLGAFTVSMFYAEGARHGFKQIYKHALWETYDAGQPFGVPFVIGELCRGARVSRALVVGPPPETPLGPRSAEFAHATRRILEGLGIEMAWIPYAGLQVGAHYLNAHLDLARLPRPS